jgi:hypothetical protein
MLKPSLSAPKPFSSYEVFTGMQLHPALEDWDGSSQYSGAKMLLLPWSGPRMDFPPWIGPTDLQKWPHSLKAPTIVYRPVLIASLWIIHFALSRH